MVSLELPQVARHWREELFNRGHALGFWANIRLQKLPGRTRTLIKVTALVAGLLALVVALVMLERFSPWIARSYGVVMVMFSLAAIVGGMPKEIAENHRNKTAPRTLRRFLIFGFAAYLMRTVYTGSIGDWLTAAAALPGAAGAFVLLVQQHIYPAPRETYIPVRVSQQVFYGPDGAIRGIRYVISAGSLAVENDGTPVTYAKPGEAFFTFANFADGTRAIGGNMPMRYVDP